MDAVKSGLLISAAAWEVALSWAGTSGGVLGVPVSAETEFSLLKNELFLGLIYRKVLGSCRMRSWERGSRFGSVGGFSWA